MRSYYYFFQAFAACTLTCAFESAQQLPHGSGNSGTSTTSPGIGDSVSAIYEAYAQFEHPAVGAVYFMTNDPRGNSIVSNSVLADGRLGFSKSFPTGGLGGYIFSYMNTSGDADSLGSQNSLIVKEDMLFAVNAGSNTVSMFTINRKYHTELTRVGSVPSGGDFPVSLAFSHQLQMLCVLNGGPCNGIQCFAFERIGSDGKPNLRALPSVLKSLGLQMESTPRGPVSVSDLRFTPDSSQLVVTVKGNISPGSRGFIKSFHVERTRIGNPVHNEPAGSSTPFGFQFIPGTGIKSLPMLVFADNGASGFGIARLEGTGVISGSQMTIVPGQIDTCWTTFSPRSGSLFTSDKTANVVTESALDLSNLTAQILNQYNVTGGPLDETVVSLADKDVLYVLAPRLPGIQVLSVLKPGKAKLIQSYIPSGTELEFPLNSGASGMAHYLMH